MTLGAAVNAVMTVTDGDGDVATNSVAIGSQIVFEDDGPSAAIAVTGTLVTHDETAGLQNATATPGVPGDANDNDVAGPLAVFNGVTTKSTDMVGFAVSAGPVVSSAGSSTGEDEEGATTVFSLAIANANSGLLTTDGDAITLTLEAGIVVGRDVGGNAVFAISIDAATGVVSVAQYKSIEHPTGGASYDEPVTLGAAVNAVMTVTDGDGDVATNSVAIGSQIVFEDDGPSAAIAVTGTLVTHDETAGLQNATATPGVPGDANDNDVAGPLAVFDGVTTKSTDMVGFAVSAGPVVSSAGSSTGEDEEGATTVFSLSVANPNSGLLTTDGDAITLTLEAGIVVGRDVGGNAVFAISIDAQSGVVSVAQYESIEHPTGGASYDEPVTLGAAVNAVMTVTDGDGDVATNSVAIGSQIVFEDDGPSAAIAVTGTLVTHDETAGLQNATATPGVPGDANDNDVAGPLAVFNGVTTKSTDMVGFAVSAGPVVSSAGSSTGEDEEGATTVFSLSVANPNSGLLTTDGDAITLTLEAGIVVGRDVGGNAVFAISIDAQSGVVSVAQYESIEHPTGGASYDEPVTLGAAVNAVMTVTDGDGDVATNSVAIGSQIVFEDDGPSAAIAVTGTLVTHDETAGLQNATATPGVPGDANDNDVAGPLAVFNGVATKSTDMVGFAVSAGPVVSSAGSSTGEDEEGATTAFSLAIANANSGLLTTDGDAITLTLEAGIVVGRDVGGNAVFAISIDAATGVVSVAQYELIEHPTGGASYDEPVTLGAAVNAVMTVTDGDGDVATNSVAIGSQIVFEDDGPSAAIAVTGTLVTHDETAGLQNATATPGVPGDANDNDVAGPLAVFNGVTTKSTDMVGFAVSAGPVVSSAGSSTGEDEEGATTVFSLSVANANSGLLTTDGDAITLTLEAGIVVGRDVGGNAVFAISIDAQSGVVSVAQYKFD